MSWDRATGPVKQFKSCKAFPFSVTAALLTTRITLSRKFSIKTPITDMLRYVSSIIVSSSNGFNMWSAVTFNTWKLLMSSVAFDYVPFCNCIMQVQYLYCTSIQRKSDAHFSPSPLESRTTCNVLIGRVWTLYIDQVLGVQSFCTIRYMYSNRLRLYFGLTRRHVRI